MRFSGNDQHSRSINAANLPRERGFLKDVQGSQTAFNRGKQFPQIPIPYARLSGLAHKSWTTARASTARDMHATGANNRSRADAARLMSPWQGETKQTCRAPDILAANPDPGVAPSNLQIGGMCLNEKRNFQ